MTTIAVNAAVINGHRQRRCDHSPPPANILPFFFSFWPGPSPISRSDLTKREEELPLLEQTLPRCVDFGTKT
ncbi:hypothetical protein Scep_014735 [Stephania cephalantha]|uniref:Uncharacterized protein n=1 Tax=Stephania cephalantha TaxID=152367 RepID=A0AAP0P0S3_9MAGN